MAKTALAQLSDDIEALRREAFAAGYAAAMQAIRELTSQPAPGMAGAPRRGRAAASAPAVVPARARQRRVADAAAVPPQRRGSPRPRLARGTNAQLVEEVLKANAPRALPQAQIRGAIQRDRGVAIAFASIRHALGQLQARHVAEQVGDSNTWRYAGAGSG